MTGSNRGLGRLAVSFIIDSDPIFAYTGWHLAHSLVDHLRMPWFDVHVQFTPEVPSRTVEEFEKLGCSTHRLARFGDGRYCNKLEQWENLRGVPADHFIFLDTDMICIDDFSACLTLSAISAKVVDHDNPHLPLLKQLFDRAGFVDQPPVVPVEARDAYTFQGNCNGGFYSVPRYFADALFNSWRRFALSLLDDIEPLRSAGKENHVDQISFCMALHETRFPFASLASNANYFLHFSGPHSLRDPSRPLALLHYHNKSVNVVGLLEPRGAVQADEVEAVRTANEQIRANFNTRLFWDMRYRHFPDRGSGVGSRGSNLDYKRALLRAEGAETASSVLDVGCGDLEVVHALDLHNYVGIDRSTVSLKRAAELRPDWTFVEAPAADVNPAELVLCFEVAIHQETTSEYRDLIDFLIKKTRGTLIVTGYDDPTEKIHSNHMLFFHEPLYQSIIDTGRFSSVRKIGAHSNLVVYRCDVTSA